jgi:hypothetical protein
MAHRRSRCGTQSGVSGDVSPSHECACLDVGERQTEKEPSMHSSRVIIPTTMTIGALAAALSACSSEAGTGNGPNGQTSAGGGFVAPSAGGAQAPGNGGAVGVPTGGTPSPGSGGTLVAAGGAPNYGGKSSPGGAPIGGFPIGGSPVGGSGGIGNVGGVPNGGAGGDPIPPGSGGASGSANAGCEGETMPAITDYSAMGPMPTKVVNNTGSDGMYTVFAPSTLGANGFKHPIATWGNGITTTPSYYTTLLGTLASHGFVIIASNSSNVTAQLMTAGLDWMIAQNAASGTYQGTLNTTCLVTIGYSLGGGASVGAGAHKDVVATASMHGVMGAAGSLHAPLLLLTSETDTFVVPATFVTPTYNASKVQTFYGTLSAAGDPSNGGHLIPVDLLPSAPNVLERAAMVAWLRLWVYNDQGAKKYFYGDDCVLCKAPWAMPQRKNWP